MTPKQSFLRRCLAVLSAAVLAAALVIIGTWLPAGATGTHGQGGDRHDVDRLRIVLITDHDSGLQYPVQGRLFDVVVQAVDDDGKPIKVSQPTRIELKEVSGPGDLGGNTTAIIQAGFSSTTIYGATYSKFANGVNTQGPKVCRTNLGCAELRHPSSEERCGWSRHLVGRLM
jgi:hypothetical protein